MISIKHFVCVKVLFLVKHTPCYLERYTEVGVKKFNFLLKNAECKVLINVVMYRLTKLLYSTNTALYLIFMLQ
jgi:uncharacterized membrane protein